MNTYLVVTVTCPDRPGLVERMTEVLAGFSANWEESRMAHLGGDFAGIIKIGVAPEEAEELATALRAMSNEEMTVAVKVTRPSSPPPEGHKLYDLRLVGADHEGIVHSVSRYLAEQGINVETMETEVVPAPISASPLFQMAAQIKVPPSLSMTELTENLERIGDENGVDIEIRPCKV